MVSQILDLNNSFNQLLQVLHSLCQLNLAPYFAKETLVFARVA